MSRCVLAVVIAVTCMQSMASVARAQDDFVTSYWYGPPPKFTTIEQYRRIKEANFNVVMPPGPPDASITPELNRRILDYCKELGLKAVIFDPRMPKSLAAADAKARVDAIVNDYADHSAILAYFIVDEPNANDFAALGDVAAYLKRRDPRHPAYINLFPTYADPSAQLGTATYEEYVDRFVKTVDPFVISYDHYTFIKGYDRPDYFTNFAIVRNAAITSKRPFWNIAQLVRHYDYRGLTEPELRFQAMQTLAFGGRGLLWYTYWYPGEPNPTVDGAMIRHDGSADASYEWIKSINADARAIGNALAHAQCWGTFHTGDPVQYPAPPKTPITIGGTGLFTTGVFKRENGQTLALVTNRDYRNEGQPVVRVAGDPRIERFDPAAGTWSLLQGGEIALPAGAAALLRW